ncbi:Inhibitor of apoptosis protein [Astathelohania contejeani]|uniref:Inhibitor of apoptosis protein n=1 Tax=Astathelohania contejeani TaxID=164912 RepID=A0ABQ7HWT8_9MICR|nr:Inhibitor of apoptosis protein [Thelohania contejeani]
MNEVIDNLGLIHYQVAKHIEYSNYETRLQSYIRWPERVKQTPEQLTTAGFFYCGNVIYYLLLLLLLLYYYSNNSIFKPGLLLLLLLLISQTGLSDHVRCYYCGNGLRNWESTDDVWVAHARWYPTCTFVISKKGLNFINEVEKKSKYFFFIKKTKKY